MLQLLILQADTTNVVQKVKSTFDSMSAVAWVSFFAGIISIIVGLIAIFQSWHYRKMSNLTEANIKTELSNMNDIVIKLQAVNENLNTKVFDVLNKTISKAIGSKGNPVEFKKDIEKAITDVGDSMEIKLKNVFDTVDRQGKESQVGLDDLKAQMMILNQAVQRMFKIAIKQLEPEITEPELKRLILDKITMLTDTLTFCSFKDLLEVISHQEFSFNRIIEELKKMKDEKLIMYDGDEIYHDTTITIHKEK
jgi:hypothetical protein